MFGRKIGALAVVAALAWAGEAKADILFVDTNDQASERAAILELGRQHGQTVHIVKSGDDPALEALLDRANKGEITLDTMVASGHSSGTGFAGKNGSMYNVDDLLTKYPNVSGKVRHFIGLGCYTGTRYNATEWQRRFPNATTISGFNGIAPSGTWSVRFLKQVFNTIQGAKSRNGGTNDRLAEKLGSSPSELAQLKRVLAGLESVRITVGSFVVCDQFYDPKGRSRERLAEDVRSGQYRFSSYFNGWTPIPENPHAPSPLRVFYNDLQDYLGVAPAEERAELLKQKEQTIRLIYFDNVRKAWARAHAGEIEAANRALAAAGNSPSFPTAREIAAMPREHVMALVQNLESSRGRLPEGADGDVARALVDAAVKELRDLQTPFSWID